MLLLLTNIIGMSWFKYYADMFAFIFTAWLVCGVMGYSSTEFDIMYNVVLPLVYLCGYMVYYFTYREDDIYER